jgi:hypothetical protein
MDDAPEDAGRVEGLRERLRSLIAGEIVQHVDLEESEAEAIATAVLDHAAAQARDQPVVLPDHYLSPSTAILTWWRQEASAALTCARATERCPGGSAWWLDEGIPVIAFLMEGEATYAETEQAEILAGPYDRAVDFNWPGSILAERLPGLEEGKSFLAGDGEGNRARYQVERREGRLIAQMEPNSWINHTEDLWSAAHRELTTLLDIEEAVVRDCDRWFRARDHTLLLEQTSDGWSTRVLDREGVEVATHGRGGSREVNASMAAMSFRWRPGATENASDA